ncbi:MAG: flippase activity-associated protein Agl23 [Pseudomonadota bacterium]
MTGHTARTTRFWIAGLSLMVVALTLRLHGLDERVLHGDEALNAQRVEDLRALGHDRDLARILHGPTLPLLSVPIVILTSPLSANADVTPYRMVSAICGTLLVGLTLLFAPWLGRRASLLGAMLVTVEPSSVYLSRFYLHESLFVLLGGAFLLALLRYLETPSRSRAVLLGLLLGLLVTTKETWLLMAPAVVLGVLVYRRAQGPSTSLHRRTRSAAWELGITAVSCVAAAVLIGSQGFTNPHGVVALVRAFAGWVHVGASGQLGVNAQPWWYYLQHLFWYRDPAASGTLFSLLPLLLLGAVSLWLGAHGLDKKTPTLHLLQAYAFSMLLVYSIIPYKTPWNVLGSVYALCLLAAVGTNRLLQLGRGTLSRGTVLVVTFACVLLLAYQSYLLGAVWNERTANPYNHAHTHREVLQLVQLCRDLAENMTDGLAIPMVTVFAADQHVYPLPFYLRHFSGRQRLETVPEKIPPVALIITTERDLDRVRSATVTHYTIRGFLLRPGVRVFALVRSDIWRALHGAQAPVSP